MKFEDIKTLKDLIIFISENKILVYGSDNNNKVEMRGNRINIILNSVVVFSRVLDSETILMVSETILYLDFECTDLEYVLSPLELDKWDRFRKEREKRWVTLPEKILIPYFTPTYLLYVCFSGTIPTMYEFGSFYKDAYTREINIDEKDSRDFVYLISCPDDRCWVGEILEFDGVKEVNKLLRFKEEFKTDSLVVYDFTTRHLYKRIHSNFGSISRDFCNVLRFDKNGAEVYYSSSEDSYGCDISLNKLDMATYNDTSSGKSMRKEKVEYRHDGRIKNQIELLIGIDRNNKYLYTIDDDVALYIIKKVNNLKENEKLILRTDSIKKELEREAIMKSLLS